MKGSTVADFRERFIVDELPGIYGDTPSRYTLRSASELGSLKSDQLYGRYFSVSRIDLQLKQNVIIEVNENLTDKVGFYMLDRGRGGMPLFGHTRFSDSGYIGGGECYLAFNPSLNEIHQFDAQNARPLYLEVTADYFTSLLDGSERFLDSLKQKIVNREFFGMKTRLTSAHYRVVDTMYDCPFHGSLGNLSLEGSLQQFVALHLAPFAQPETIRQSINSRDREIIYAVRDYLNCSFLDHHSIQGLSKRFGINQNKLKKLFKESFGVPVIEYLYDLKMKHAHQLLFDDNRHVGEVSAIVGYKNANHFSTAFKRKFGKKPSRI
jgi:AraC-like DNA-binding protein